MEVSAEKAYLVELQVDQGEVGKTLAPLTLALKTPFCEA